MSDRSYSVPESVLNNPPPPPPPVIAAAEVLYRVGQAKPQRSFWKAGFDAPGQHLLEERVVQENSEAGTSVVYNNNHKLSIDQQRQRLPVFKHRNQLLYLVDSFRTVIIIGETGSGKSTQVPQYLFESGLASEKQLICVTQPRRVAVVTVATRVAEERGVFLGKEVGYAMRFDEKMDNEETKIKFMTDGLLVRELMSDPLLKKFVFLYEQNYILHRRYSVIMLDEVHERTLYSDVIIGLLKKVQHKRPDLKLIISSATLDANKFKEFFNFNDSSDNKKETATILSIEGRTFPIDVFYCIDPVPDYVKATLETILKIHKNESHGDVLAFLTGQDEVEHVVKLLIEEAKEMLSKKENMKMRVLPMYGSLPMSEQVKVFERVGQHCRKVVVATNIAEASITIPGVVYVVDCGFVKLPVYNPNNGVDSLIVTKISQASAQQRAGRAGRVRKGKVFRLYPEEQYDLLPLATVPEMQRTRMDKVVLQLKALGINNLLNFSFLSAPPAQNVALGLEILYALDAIDDNCQLTTHGLRMAEFPLNPMFTQMLLSSGELGCSEEAATITAMMQIQSVFISPSRNKASADKAKRLFSCAEGDHVTLLNVYRSFVRAGKTAKWCHQHFLNYKGMCRAVEIRSQLERMMTRFKVKMKSCKDDVESLQRCLVRGFFANAARLHYSGEYRTVRNDHPLHVHPTSVLYPEKPAPFVIYNEVIHTNKEYMRDITVIEPSWLYELAPHYYEYGTKFERAAKRSKSGLNS